MDDFDVTEIDNANEFPSNEDDVELAQKHLISVLNHPIDNADGLRLRKSPRDIAFD